MARDHHFLLDSLASVCHSIQEKLSSSVADQDCDAGEVEVGYPG